VLDSSRLARLRDLPAYLLASQKLQRCIHKYARVNGAGRGDGQERLEDVINEVQWVKEVAFEVKDKVELRSQLIEEYLAIEKDQDKA
jgi:hypothetical protein